jgi:hypothetical protein
MLSVSFIFVAIVNPFCGIARALELNGSRNRPLIGLHIFRNQSPASQDRDISTTSA